MRRYHRVGCTVKHTRVIVMSHRCALQGHITTQYVYQSHEFMSDLVSASSGGKRLFHMLQAANIGVCTYWARLQLLKFHSDVQGRDMKFGAYAMHGFI